MCEHNLMTIHRLKSQGALALVLLVVISAAWLARQPAPADPDSTVVSGPLATAFLVPFEFGGQSQRYSPEERRCLALNIYWEARSEPVRGQIAVGAVTLNRVADEQFPADVCSVVYQGGESRLYRCQFSWWCDGKKDDPLEPEAWAQAQVLAERLIEGAEGDPTDGALWYHADYVKPDWRTANARSAKIGRHVFYRRES